MFRLSPVTFLVALALLACLTQADDAASSYSPALQDISTSNGCVASFGLDFGCPFSRYAEVSLAVGDSGNDKSDKLGLVIKFVDSADYVLASFAIEGYGCNWHEFGKIDSLKVCGGWVQEARKIVLEASKDDGLHVTYLYAAIGARSAYKKDFWLDNPVQAAADYSNKPAFKRLIIPV